MSVSFRERLGVRLTAMAVACGFTVGLVLSVTQIWLDYREERRSVRTSLSQALEVLQEPAHEAVYSLDPALAQHVLQGLASQAGVYQARLLAYPDQTLAQLERPRPESRLRWLTNRLFGLQNEYVIRLQDPGGGPVLGELQLAVDTYQAGRAFLGRALVILVSGVLRSALLAVLLLLLFQRWLTRPLQRLVSAFAAVDPEAPARFRLGVPKGHERDELGLWIERTNALLQAVQDHQARRREAEAQTVYLQQFDRLTNLPNRTLFYGRAEEALRRARAQQQRLAILLCDLREFRSFNEAHGRAMGDALLQAFARAVNDVLPLRLSFARLAADRFGLLQDEVERVDRAAELAERLMRCAAGPLVVDGQAFPLSLAIGIALFPDNGQALDPLIHDAELALREAKRSRHSRYCFYSAALGAQVRDRQQLERDLEAAIAGQQFRLDYQPQFELAGGRLTGVEALLRWAHPLRGAVPPAEFVPVAEACGLIVPIGRWALREACRAALAWHSEPPIRVAVNVSAVQVQQSDLCADVFAALEASGLPPERLEIELTETAAVTDIEHTREVFARLRAAGIQVALDDFGTGQSSLSQLRRMPINRLKIDLSFIAGVDHEETKATIVRAIISLGHGLGHQVIAEGVAEADELAFLRQNACDEVQGYLCSPPVSGVDLQAVLNRGRL